MTRVLFISFWYFQTIAFVNEKNFFRWRRGLMMHYAGQDFNQCIFLPQSFQDTYSPTSQLSKMELFAKIINDSMALTIFAKNLCLRCLTGF